MKVAQDLVLPPILTHFGMDSDVAEEYEEMFVKDKKNGVFNKKRVESRLSNEFSDAQVKKIVVMINDSVDDGIEGM